VQHPLEHAPTAVQNGFGHPCSDQLLAAHIAHKDCFVSIHYPATELVQRIRSAAGGLAV
jgi:hypothetical protein